MTDCADGPINGSKVYTPADYKSRIEIWSKMEVGDEAKFFANGPIEYANIRGSAYGWGRPKHKVFRAHRIDENVIVVRRIR